MKANTTSTRLDTVPQGIQYNKKTTEYQLFPEEYFSASDCYIYFNDIWLDEITALSFELREVVRPIFSYASNTWDYLARGQRIVQGYFKIAFKEAGYIWTVLDHIGQLGADGKNAIGMLLNNDLRTVTNPNYGYILENIDELLTRRQIETKDQKEPDKIVKEKKTLYFKWPVPIKMNDHDGMEKYQNQEERYGLTTAIRQLQTWLKNHGYSWPAKKFNWKYYYDGDTWWRTLPGGAKHSVYLATQHFNNKYIKNRIGRRSGKWYMMLRFFPDGPNIHQSIYGPVYASQYEMELQQRLDTYPGKLAGYWMGSPDGKVRYDGRWGSGPTTAIRMLYELAEEQDPSNGYWLTDRTKQLLEMGFSVNGKYDLPTKIAVWSFQQKMREAGKYSKQPNGIVDKETRDLMTEQIEVDKVIPGKSLWIPEHAYENRMAIYEREIWGRPFVENGEEVRQHESFFYRPRYTAVHPEGTMLSLWQKGFDIYINYGPLPQYMIQQKDWKKSQGEGLSFNTTVKAIRNVQITDVQQVIDAKTGEPIEEIYYFIAKDLD